MAKYLDDTALSELVSQIKALVNTKYTKPSGGIPASDLAESYYLSSNPNGYTKVEGSSTNGNIKINNVETPVYSLPSDVVYWDDTGTTTNIKDENGNTLYPVTKTSEVLDANDDNLDTILAGKQNSLSSSQMEAVNSGATATKVTMFETTSYKGRAELYGINSDMNIGVNDTPVINLRERRNNPKINYTLNSTNDGIIVPAGVRQVKVTSIMCYLPKSNNENFNNVIKLNGSDVPDYQGYIYTQAPIANIRTSLCNIVVINVSAGDVISFVTKAPATDVNNPAVLQRTNTHFIIETLQTDAEA